MRLRTQRQWWCPCPLETPPLGEHAKDGGVFFSFAWPLGEIHLSAHCPRTRCKAWLTQVREADPLRSGCSVVALSVGVQNHGLSQWNMECARLLVLDLQAPGRAFCKFSCRGQGSSRGRVLRFEEDSHVMWFLCRALPIYLSSYLAMCVSTVSICLSARLSFLSSSSSIYHLTSYLAISLSIYAQIMNMYI